MGRKGSKFAVVTKKDDPSFVRMFGEEDARNFVGPEYDKKGFVLTVFEKKTETYFSEVVEEKQKDEPDEQVG